MNWGVIPELFYDFIGRVLPGSLLLVLAVFVFSGVQPGIQHLLALAKDAPLATFSLQILFSYFIAVLMQQPWQLLQNRTDRKLSFMYSIAVLMQQPWQLLQNRTDRKPSFMKAYWSIRRQRRLEISPGQGQIKAHIQSSYDVQYIDIEPGASPQVMLPDDGIILSSIRRKLPVEGYRLLKIQAEKAMCEAMISGLMILVGFDVCRLTDYWPQVWRWLPVWRLPAIDRERILLFIFLIVSLVAMWMWRKALEYTYLQSLYALWYMLEIDPVPGVTPISPEAGEGKANDR